MEFVRNEALLQTKLLESFLASDVNLIVRFCLLGKFYEVPKPLFRRRIHPGELSRSKQVKDILMFYNPSTNQKSALKFCRLNLEHLRAVWRSSAGIADKLRLYGLLLKKLIWDRKVISAEVKNSLSRRKG